MAANKGNAAWIKGGPSPNPSGRPARTDGWSSLVTGLGDALRDKRMSAEFATEALTPRAGADLWRGDDLAARIVETLPDEMLREGWQLQIADDPSAKDRADRLTARCEDLDVDGAFWRALCAERAMGGGAVLLGIADGAASLEDLVDPNRAARLDWLTPLDALELAPDRRYKDPRHPKYGEPETYRLTGTKRGAVIHESRLIVFDGVRTRHRQLGWGDSVLTRCYRVLADFNMSWGSAAALVQDFSQAVFKLKDLATVLANDKSGKFAARMQAMDTARSILRATVIDSSEDFERKATPLGGLPELLDRFATRLAAAANMPVTLLMGQSPAGLNATGASDIRFFYDRVAATQRRKLLPALTKVAKLLLRADGGEPAKWAITFAPLWQQSDKEIAEARYIQAQADALYIANQVLSPEEVASSRFGGDEYSFETTRTEPQVP